MPRARASSGGGGRWVIFYDLGDLDADGAQLVEVSCSVGGIPSSSTRGGWQRPRRSGNSASDPTQASSLAICPSLA